MSRLVGLIVVPMDVSGFAGIAAAFDAALPGCTLGESRVQDIADGDVRYTGKFVPVFVDDETA